MAWCPLAKKRELQPESDAQAAIRPTQFIVHSLAAAWTPERTFEFWRDSTNLESHFGLGYDGSLMQYIGTETRADANAAANRRADGTGAISLESASNLQASDPWTAAQVEKLIQVGVWAHQQHAIPLRLCRSADDPGFGHHRMFSAWNPNAHSCPGDARVKQFRDVVFPGIVARANGQIQPPTEDDMPDYVNLGLAKPFTLKPGIWDSIEFTKEWSDTANDHGTNGAVFVRGAARFSGSVSLTVSGLPVGDVVQVRMSEYDADKALVTSHPIDEVIGTPGGSFGVVPLVKRIGKDRGMRVRVLNQSAVPVTITDAVLTALVFKES
ncbi:N-acetylmuramoyl-L-alanine amidase [[Kitasatospora] papulosa]|uniref:N-acetylmuramoyl-L-alanine amidase n=1 Tax=[Kitasatospora] papulosa TaxID=1464011 RepID=UPI0036C05182